MRKASTCPAIPGSSPQFTLSMWTSSGNLQAGYLSPDQSYLCPHLWSPRQWQHLCPTRLTLPNQHRHGLSCKTTSPRPHSPTQSPSMPHRHVPWRVAMLGCGHQDDIRSSWCYPPPHIQPVPPWPPCQRETRSAPKATICTLQPHGLGSQWWCPQGIPTAFPTLGHQTHQRFLRHEQNDETLVPGSLRYLPLLWMHGKSTTCPHLPTPWLQWGHQWAGCMVWSIPYQSEIQDCICSTLHLSSIDACFAPYA